MIVPFASDGSKLHFDLLWAALRHRFIIFCYFCAGLALLPVFFIPVYVFFWTRYFFVAVYVKVRWRLLGMGGDGASVASGMDTTWTCDIPGINYSLTTVLFLDGLPNTEDIKQRIEQQLRQKALQKFRKHLVEIYGLCVWKDADRFCLDDHVVLIEDGDSISTDRELQDVLADMSTRPFPKESPPWQVVILPLAFPSPKGQPQFCVAFRADHTLADGLSLVYLLMNHVMDCPEVPPPPPPPPQSTKYVLYSVWRKLHAFYHTPDSALLFLTRTESNPLHGKPLTKQKIVRWSRPVALSTLKRMRSPTGATINDLYLSCLAGSLRRHLASRSPESPSPVTALIPISLNSSAQNIEFHNNISVVHVPLPVHVADIRSRLSATSALMADFKRSPELLVNGWMCRRLVNCLPLATTRKLFRVSPATVVSSTVPGPPAPISLWGHTINSMRYFSPHRGKTGLTACFMSYAGQATLTLYADAALVDSAQDVDRMVDWFHDEVDQLVKMTDNLLERKGT